MDHIQYSNSATIDWPILSLDNIRSNNCYVAAKSKKLLQKPKEGW